MNVSSIGMPRRERTRRRSCMSVEAISGVLSQGVVQPRGEILGDPFVALGGLGLVKAGVLVDHLLVDRLAAAAAVPADEGVDDAVVEGGAAAHEAVLLVVLEAPHLETLLGD